MQLVFTNLAVEWPDGIAVIDGDIDSVILSARALAGHYSGDQILVSLTDRNGNRHAWNGEADTQGFYSWLEGVRLAY